MTYVSLRRFWAQSFVFLAGSAVWLGCSGKGGEEFEGESWDDAENIGQATFELKQVPASGVSCIRISVVGSTTVTKDFGNLAANSSTSSLNMDRLPLGNVTVSAMAYSASTSATACNTSTAPTWVADPTSTLLEPGVAATLALTFRKNNPVSASVNFVGNIEALSAGTRHTLLLVDGQVYQWGAWSGSATQASVPTLVASLTGVTSIAAGGEFSCATKNDGSIWCWGVSPAVGVTSTTPAQFAPGLVYDSVEASATSACALTSDSAYCWGVNSWGKFGDGSGGAQLPPPTPHTSTVKVSPVAVLGLGEQHICQVLSSLDAVCAGHNLNGQLIRSTTETFSAARATIGSPNSPYVDVAVGISHTLLLMADGTVRAAGLNSKGQLGRGTTTSDSNTGPAPVAIASLTGVEAVSANETSSFALLADGSVKSWGDNTYGQLGDATHVDRTTPVLVKDLPPVRLMASGRRHSCAVTVDEQVYCWGQNSSAQLGNGSTIDAPLPVPVVLP